MKLNFLMLVFTLASSLVFAQNEAESKESDMMNVLEPEFKGINEAVGIVDFLQENLCYPKNALETETEGTVIIQFKVLPTGNLSEFLVINSVSPECDKAVISALEATNGMWNPGTKNGYPVTMEKEVTVVFKSEGIEMYKTAQLYSVRADKALKADKYRRAIKLYNKAIVMCPNHSETLYRRGLARYYSGDLKGALNDFAKTVDLGSHQADSMLVKLHEEGVSVKGQIPTNSRFK
jgi:TonB family protein